MTNGKRRSRLLEFERDRRGGGDAVLGVCLNGRVVGGCGLHRRIAADGLEIGYWLVGRVKEFSTSSAKATGGTLVPSSSKESACLNALAAVAFT